MPGHVPDQLGFRGRVDGVHLLFSSDAAATVPAMVTVPAGAISAPFVVTTTGVAVSTDVQIQDIKSRLDKNEGQDTGAHDNRAAILAAVGAAVSIGALAVAIIVAVASFSIVDAFGISVERP